MPLDLSGFTQQPNQWAGLYHGADQLEKSRLRQEQLDLQKQSKRAAAGTFLQNYLDPKDLMTGTNYDPMIVQGLQAAQQQGAQLAAAGADAPTLMMALGPMVNKLTQYSTNAKTINKQVDDQIKLMRESGLNGYDYGKLKDLAMKKAFYKQGANGREMIDPGDIDPSTNYLQKAIEENPEQVTTAAGLDLFAKNSPMNKELIDRQHFTGQGEQDRSKVHLIGQNWLTPVRDATGKITDLVPKHDIATENGQPLFHEYKDETGKTKRDQVKLLSEDVFDDMMQRRPDIADYMKGIVKQHLTEYRDKTGDEISLNDPRAKNVARAIAWNELNRRKTSTIERADIIDKPSQAQIRLNVGSTPEWQHMIEANSQARTQGRVNVTGQATPLNPAQVIGGAFNNDSNVLQGEPIDKDGKKVYDITSMFLGGGLKSGRGANYKYKGIFYDPNKRSLMLDKEHTDQMGLKFNTQESIPEKDIGQFIYKIAQSNGMSLSQVQKLLQQIGYSKGKFKNVNPLTDKSAEQDFNKKVSWRDALKSPFGNQLNSQQ